MVASALVTAAGLAYVGRRYFYKKARKWASRNRNKIAAGVATLAMSYRGKRKRSVSRGRSRTRSHVNKKRRVDSVDSGYESYPRLHAKSLLSLVLFLFPFVRSQNYFHITHFCTQNSSTKRTLIKLIAGKGLWVIKGWRWLSEVPPRVVRWLRDWGYVKMWLSTIPLLVINSPLFQ